jgi:ParB family chromosome partitioning protein
MPFVDNGNVPLTPAVTLTYLKDDEQTAVADCIKKLNLSVDMKKADMLRKHSEKGRLDEDAIKRILSGSVAHKPNRTPTVKIQKAVYAKYFKPNQSTREIESIVEKALAMYFGNQ